MLIVKTNPKGIDWHIQKLQTQLHNQMVDRWALQDASKYECYGRCYRNKNDNGYVAEVFSGGNEYKEVYWNDVLTAISFFGAGSTVRVGIKNEAQVHFIMFADLQKLGLKDKDGNEITHRADEELRTMVQDVIGKSSYGFSIESVDLWLENVLREYPGSRRDERLKAVDMHPVHCFRVNLKLIYDPNKIC